MSVGGWALNLKCGGYCQNESLEKYKMTLTLILKDWPRHDGKI